MEMIISDNFSGMVRYEDGSEFWYENGVKLPPPSEKELEAEKEDIITTMLHMLIACEESQEINGYIGHQTMVELRALIARVGE